MVHGYSAYEDVSLVGRYESTDAPNEAPIASFDANFNLGLASFTSTSTDSDGSVVDWSWDFGDGSSASGESVAHEYAASGVYSVSLTVADNDGAR